MYTYHLKNILESNKWDNKIVINKIKKWGCTIEKEPIHRTKRCNIWVHGWREKIIPPHAPSDYLNLINRLDDDFVYEYAGETFKPTSRVQLSGRIYTTMTSATKRLNFQAAKSTERSKFTWKGLSLVNYDLSASQLRIALALKGCTIPLHISPWDSLNVEHQLNEALPADIAREFKKTVGLLVIRGEKRIDYDRIWVEKIGAPLKDKPSFKGYIDALKNALSNDFPALSSIYPSISITPDGYVISHRSKLINRHEIHSRPLGIKTTYKRHILETPTQGNILEAMEANVLRDLIRTLPIKSPVLTCHDQLYVLESDLNDLKKNADDVLSKLAHNQPT